MSISNELRRTIKYPTSLIVNGAEILGIELAKSLLDQGGYVVMLDTYSEYSVKLVEELKKYDLFTFVDISETSKLEDFLRRLDYVFFLNHKKSSLEEELSSQEFLEFSKFLDSILDLAKKFDSKFLATTSVKAHQYMFIHKEIETNINPGSEIHTVYKEFEFQRYLESLTFEYIQKKSLDARIIRVGEIIGEGIDFDKDTPLGRLVFESINEDELIIYGDGLNSDFYVHLQDAVYGIIKAQFTKNTRGEIYTLAYEYEISILSIAYKLLEFLDEPKEIVFSQNDDEDDDDITLRLYKPAPNLMRIGWNHRISFERALKHTYEYVKKLYSDGLIDEEEEEIVPVQVKKKSLKEIVRGIFYANNEKAEEDPEEEYTGALGRLIKERKEQENGRKGSILLSNKQLQYRLNKNKELSINESVGSKVTKRFDAFADKFDFLRYITIRQFIFMVLVFVCAAYLYVNFFSEVVNISKDIYYILDSTQNINKSVESNEYSNITSEYDYLSTNLEDANNRILKLGEYFGSINEYKNIEENIGQLNSNINLLNEGIDDSYKGTINVEKYLTEFDPKVIYRPSSNSLLNLENVKEYSDLVNKIDSTIPIASDGIDKIERANKNLRESPLIVENTEFKNVYDNFVTNNDRVSSRFNDLLKVGNVINPLLSGEKNYVLLLVDNTSYLPVGGFPVNIVEISIKNGGIQKIASKRIDENNYSLADTDALILREINALNTSFVDNSNGSLDDLFYLQQGNLYFDEIARIISKQSNTRVDGVFIANLNFLKRLLRMVDGVEYEQVNFNEENFIVNLNLLVENNQNPVGYKREIFSNMFALLIQNILNDLDGGMSKLITIVKESIESKDITYKLIGSSLPMNDSSSDNLNSVVSDFINVASISDITLNEGVKVPSAKLNVNLTINQDKTVRKTVNIDYSQLVNFESTAICYPSLATNLAYKENLKSNIIERSTELVTCIYLNDINIKNFEISYDFPLLVNDQSEFDYELGIRKQPGFDLEYNVQISTENMKITNNSSGGESSADKLTYSGLLKSDMIVGLDIQDGNN